jgi:hypothetical protein
VLNGISIPTVEFEIPITFDNFDPNFRRKSKLILIEIPYLPVIVQVARSPTYRPLPGASMPGVPSLIPFPHRQLLRAVAANLAQVSTGILM